MSDNRYLGKELFNISRLIRRSYDEYMENNSKKEDIEEVITTNNAEILSYLHVNNDKNIYQKDIEELLSIKAPTVTEILKKMEQKKLVIRENSKIDGRYKVIKITEKGIKVRLDTLDKVTKLEKHIEKSITIEEKVAFLDILDKIKDYVK